MMASRNRVFSRHPSAGTKARWRELKVTEVRSLLASILFSRRQVTEDRVRGRQFVACSEPLLVFGISVVRCCFHDDGKSCTSRMTLKRATRSGRWAIFRSLTATESTPGALSVVVFSSSESSVIVIGLMRPYSAGVGVESGGEISFGDSD